MSKPDISRNGNFENSQMSQPFRLILGIATFCICIWIRFDLDFWEWVIEINWYTYWYCTYFIMITMLLVVINSLIGAYAIIYVSTYELLTACFHEIRIFTIFESIVRWFWKKTIITKQTRLVVIEWKFGVLFFVKTCGDQYTY